MKVMLRAEVEARTALPTSTLYELMSSGNFPRPVRISRRRVAWVEAEIDDWIKSRIAERDAAVLHGDARESELGGPYDGIVTSPPYPGLIDYHEQHRYAYELLGLDDRSGLEIGAAAAGTSQAAVEEYRAGIAAALSNAAASLPQGAPVLIVVNDRRDLYPEILDRAGLWLESRLRRHVNRRTGRRAGAYYEDVLVARTA